MDWFDITTAAARVAIRHLARQPNMTVKLQ